MSIVDALTDRAMVVLQDRPLVPLTPWLASTIAECTESGRTLQLVTPLETRLSLPLRTAAEGDTVHWIVRNGDGYYEGLTGRPFKWDGGTFVPVPEARDYAPGFTTRPTAPIGSQLSLVYRLRHDADADLSGAVERLLQLLTGQAPAGFGTHEPLADAWRGDAFTQAVKGRPDARLLVGGDGPRAALAMCDFRVVGAGIAEVTTVTVGYSTEDPPPLQHLPSLVGALAAERPVASMFVQLTPGRADLTTEPRWTGQTAPVALAVTGQMSGPSGIPGQQVGPQRAPLTFFPLGDGRSADGWQRHSMLMQHLQSA
ncbi:DUF6177 family protein [Actinomadura sp. CNU-125]|uniref:DUF6177 family protein n=1 Tax=Actinomadura sp. CNU-125 TaxID=1904961 RepID=UPI000A94BC98|nr:DUF6177 family protein [Actinomadura sp. CNU-125]